MQLLFFAVMRGVTKNPGVTARKTKVCAAVANMSVQVIRTHFRSSCLILHLFVPPASLYRPTFQTWSVLALPYHTAPPDAHHRSSEKPRRCPSEHNQFLLQWSTMRPLQPLTLPSILLLAAAAAAGCATQMGLCSAMK